MWEIITLVHSDSVLFGKNTDIMWFSSQIRNGLV